jgi:hypothetical protein
MQVARLEAEKAALAKRSAEAAEREAMQAATLQAVNQRLAEDNAALAARVAGLERPAPGNQARARGGSVSVSVLSRCSLLWGTVLWLRRSSHVRRRLGDAQLRAARASAASVRRGGPCVLLAHE